MNCSRRKFIATAALAAAPRLRAQHSMNMGGAAPAADIRNRPLFDLSKLAPWADPLPIPAVLDTTAIYPDPDHPHHRLPYAEVVMRENYIRLHRDLPLTRAWTYNGTLPGPTIQARSGQPLLIRWTNALPHQHFLPIDHRLCGAEPSNPLVRSVVHLHGGRTPHASDGFPENWYTPGNSTLFRYPNQQDAATLWYHDHAMGINRLNTYAGMFGFYLLGDAQQDELHLPSGSHDIPIVLCDRLLDREAQFFYPTSGDPHAPWVPEVFGNAILVNGKLSPYLQVEPRRYRFRILNAANGRFFNLSLSNQSALIQIGSDQGLLSAPLPLQQIAIAPGERIEFVIDFAQMRGATFELRNDVNPILQFRVTRQTVEDRSTVPTHLRTILRPPESTAVRTRDLTLHEMETGKGESMRMLLNRKAWRDPVTEDPRLGTIEIWNLINLTEDTHPIHLHLVRFQVLDRRPFDIYTWQNHHKLLWTGEAIPADANELGWKDTVRAHSSMVTRILIPWDGYAGRYAWHCHLLEHEANEMMRPIEVLPA